MRRSADDLAKMRRAGRVVAEMHAAIRQALRPGVTTAELDRIGRGVIERRGARSNFLGYGYPPFTGVICASPNDVIVHGVPGPVRLEEGDIISIDCGAIVEGWHGDAAFTAGIGAIDPEAARLIEVTEASLAAGIRAMQPSGRLSDIGAAVQRVAEEAGFSVVREYSGHGIGLAMHEDPDIPNWGVPGKGRRLGPGQTYAVEPMVCAGRPETQLLDDQWTVVTRDGSLAAHVEHTIAVTEHGPEILTSA
ncbi:MAG: type I methionyl aminopeptidase [Acidimicrobiales bacterium]|nr:type I methionyl aminopeptidase [Acidimicrobiales bacterium]